MSEGTCSGGWERRGKRYRNCRSALASCHRQMMTTTVPIIHQSNHLTTGSDSTQTRIAEPFRPRALVLQNRELTLFGTAQQTRQRAQAALQIVPLADDALCDHALQIEFRSGLPHL
jgi:hypothetical protein